MRNRRLCAFALTLVASVLAAPAVAHGETVVSLTFDDGRATQAQVGPMLERYGVRGTFFVNSAAVGTSDYYMTWPQLDRLSAAGNEIGGHTLDHAELTTLPPTEVRRQVCDDRAALVSRGYSITSFAYPYGRFNTDVSAIVRDCGYSSARRTGGIVSQGWCPTGCSGPFAESLPPENPMVTRAPSLDDAEFSLPVLQSFVTAAETRGGGWVQIVFHAVCTGNCEDGSISPATLEAFLSWLDGRRSAGTVVKTVAGALTPSAPPPPPPPPPPPADTTAPDTTVTSAPPARTTNRKPAITFTSTEAGSSFECSLDAGAFAPCSSPYTTPMLGDGAHGIRVRSRDEAGNVDASPAEVLFTVDTTPPQTRLAAVKPGTSMTFTFSANEAATFSCSMDGKAWTRCSSPYRVTGLKERSTHTFAVRAVDVLGLVDPTPATARFTVPKVRARAASKPRAGTAPLRR